MRMVVDKDADWPVLIVSPPEDDIGPVYDVPDELVDRYQAASVAWYQAQKAIADACGIEWTL